MNTSTIQESRSISIFKQWKTSEYRACQLFYCLQVLSNLQPPDYICHLSLLVSAMHILLCDTIPMSYVKIALELHLFYHLVPELYTEELCTANLLMSQKMYRIGYHYGSIVVLGLKA